jgi:hypothetical protein
MFAQIKGDLLGVPLPPAFPALGAILCGPQLLDRFVYCPHRLSLMAAKIVAGFPQIILCCSERTDGLMDVRTASRYRDGHGHGGWGSDGCRRVKSLRLRSPKQNGQNQGGKHYGQCDNRPLHFPSQIAKFELPVIMETYLNRMGSRSQV